MWLTVIGVVKDVHYRGLGDVRPDVYESADQTSLSPQTIIVRATASPLSAVASIQKRIRQVIPRAVIGGVTTMERVVAREVAPWRLTGWLVATLSGFTLLLTLVGLVGQLGLELAHRVPEFALRMAVGATPARVRRLAIRGAVVSTTIGIVAGGAMAAAATGWLRAMLFGVTPADPLTWALALGGVAAAAIVTAGVMAGRASRLDPWPVLRAEW